MTSISLVNSQASSDGHLPKHWALAQFIANIDGLEIHFIHVKGAGPSDPPRDDTRMARLFP